MTVTNIIRKNAFGEIVNVYIPDNITPRYYYNYYYDFGDYWVLEMVRRQDGSTTIAKLDEDDVEKSMLFSWYPHHDPTKPDNLIYIKSTGGFRLHRVIMDCPADKVIDHLNHDPLDNRRRNMRICSVGENNNNLSISKRNTSGVVGVRFRADRNVWTSSRMVNGVLYSKRFKTFEEAKLYKETVLDKIEVNSTTIPEKEVEAK